METRIQAITLERESIQQEMQELDKKHRENKKEQTLKNTKDGLQKNMLKSIKHRVVNKLLF